MQIRRRPHHPFFVPGFIYRQAGTAGPPGAEYVPSRQFKRKPSVPREDELGEFDAYVVVESPVYAVWPYVILAVIGIVVLVSFTSIYTLAIFVALCLVAWWRALRWWTNVTYIKRDDLVQYKRFYLVKVNQIHSSDISGVFLDYGHPELLSKWLGIGVIKVIGVGENVDGSNSAPQIDLVRVSGYKEVYALCEALQNRQRMLERQSQKTQEHIADQLGRIVTQNTELIELNKRGVAYLAVIAGAVNPAATAAIARPALLGEDTQPLPAVTPEQ